MRIPSRQFPIHNFNCAVKGDTLDYWNENCTYLYACTIKSVPPSFGNTLKIAFSLPTGPPGLYRHTLPYTTMINPELRTSLQNRLTYLIDSYKQ